MQSQGSTSSQPSFDSLSSSDSLLLSEDDADVFLTDATSSVIGRAAAKGGRSVESPGSQWACDGFTDKEEEEESGRGGKAAHRSSEGDNAARQPPKSQGDLLFAQKCAELQGFVRPLLELLNGLKTGRFDRGLSSFQQSVAMDRIQRIVGVLQRPNSGEKYLNTLLQVEAMLKHWFPNISSQAASAASGVAASTAASLRDPSSSIPPHKHRDQLHIPVKKRRLSWTGADSPSPSPVLPKSPRLPDEQRSRGDVCVAKGAAPPPPEAHAGLNQHGGVREHGALPQYKAAQRSEPNLTWVHTAPIVSPRKSCPTHEGAPAAGGSQARPVAATQDSSVSSTTPNKHPKTAKKPTRCQSQLTAGHQGESGETSPGQSQAPLSRACPASSET